MENELITSIHERGHINARKVETLIKQDYYMDNLDIKVKNKIAYCISCILGSRKSGRQEGFLNPIDKSIKYLPCRPSWSTSINKQKLQILAISD